MHISLITQQLWWCWRVPPPSCILHPASCLPSRTSCLLAPVSCYLALIRLLSRISRVAPGSRLMSLICLLSHVFIILSPASHLAPPVSCIVSSASYQLSRVLCFPSTPASCLLHPPSCILLPAYVLVYLCVFLLVLIYVDGSSTPFTLHQPGRVIWLCTKL